MRIVNQPQFLPMEAYEDELERYLQRVNGVQSLLSVMTMGSVGAPGLSDLDIICVVEEQVRAREIPRLDISARARERGIFVHGPIVVPKSLVGELNYIFPISTLQNRWGEPLAQMVKPPAKEEQAELALVYLVDFTLSRLLQHSIVKTSGVLDKRGWLTRLWSLTHSEKLCNSAGIVLQPHWIRLLRDIRSVRERWNSGDDCSDSQFLNLYRRLEMVHRQLLSATLKREALLLEIPVPRRPVRFKRGFRRVICRKEARVPLVFHHPASMWSSVTKINYHTIYAPPEYALRLAHYGFGTPETGPLSNKVHGEILKKRAELVKEHVSFLNRSRIMFSLRGNLGLPVGRESPVFTLLHRAAWIMLRTYAHSR